MHTFGWSRRSIKSVTTNYFIFIDIRILICVYYRALWVMIRDTMSLIYLELSLQMSTICQVSGFCTSQKSLFLLLRLISFLAKLSNLLKVYGSTAINFHHFRTIVTSCLLSKKPFENGVHTSRKKFGHKEANSLS